MIYLLKSPDDTYAVCEQTDIYTSFANNGTWSYTIPYPVTAIDYPDEFTGNIYWWQRRYYEYADAKLVRKFHTLDEYNSYMYNHPELLL